uniref:Uncharacterized protein n=1 Tax=Arundo donax TaxID=35708 RepID=A0A0A9B8K5_ARUDO
MPESNWPSAAVPCSPHGRSTSSSPMTID